MTHNKRERESERLMAILQGHADAGMIDEHGTLDAIPDAQPSPRSCLLCSARLDDDEPEHEGYTLCEDCVPEFQYLMTRQVICLICEGKRLIFHGPGKGWHACIMCHGCGWIDGVVARWNAVL